MGDSVREWMTAVPCTVTRKTPAAELAELFASRRVTSVPVVDGSKVVGVVSRTDLVRSIAEDHSLAGWMFDDLMALDSEGAAEERRAHVADFAAKRLAGKSVEQLMSSGPVTVQADQEVRAVARCLVENRIHHVPVLDGAELVGVISTFDIARWLAGSGA